MNLDVSGYKDFKDFCKRNNLTAIEGIKILEQELDRRGVKYES